MKNTILFFSLIIVFLSSCKLSQETKFYSDKSSSSEIMLHMDPSITSKMNAASSKENNKQVHGKSIKDLPTDWISFYDLKLYDSIKISENSDTARLLKSIYIKYLIENGQFVGFGMKADRLHGKDLEAFGNQFNNLNPGKGIDSLKPMDAVEPRPEWDGKNLTLKFPRSKNTKVNSTKKKSNDKDKGKDNSNDMFSSMFKDANIVMTYRYAFEKKIKKIKGKHDLLRKEDDHTVIYEIDFKILKELSDKGKSIRKKDSVIVIITE